MANKDRLLSGETLKAGKSLESKNGVFELRMQDDGNLVLYKGQGKKATWASGTNGHNGAECVMKNRGILVVHKNGDLWKSDNSKSPGAYLVVQDDGNMVIYNQDKAIWSTGTR